MSEKYDKAEIAYLDSKIAWRKAKDLYELTRAKRRQVLKAEIIAEGGKPTLQDLEDRLLIEQNDLDKELGTKYLFLLTAMALKERKHQECESQSRLYWDSKGLAN